MGNITFAKAMIALCLVGSGLLGYQDWLQRQEILALQSDLRPSVGSIEKTVVETQKLGRRYAELYKALSGDALSGQDTPLSYISDLADKRDVDIGTVNIVPSKRPGSTTVDNVYTITPSIRDKTFQRYMIANFLFTLEEKSPRIRVTQIRMDQINSVGNGNTQVKATEYPSDRFTFKAQVTSRERSE